MSSTESSVDQRSRALLSFSRLAVLGILAMGCGGCLAVPLATVGTVLGFAGTAATTGSDVYNLGKLDFSVMATYDQCHQAAKAATVDLGLIIRDEEPVGKRTDECWIDLIDDRGKKLGIRIDRRASNLTQCRIDVGFFGSEPTAKLVMERMREHLPRQFEMNKSTGNR